MGEGGAVWAVREIGERSAWDWGKAGSSTAQADAFAGANAEEKVGLLRSE